MDKKVDSRGFEEIPHTADVSLIVTGTTLEDLFVHSAEGMYQIMGILVDNGPEKTIHLDIEEHDLESLLVSFLSELIYLTEQQIVACKMSLTIHDLRLSGVLVTVSMLERQIEIKAVTYNNLRIHRYDNQYETQLVFDI